MKVKVMGEPLAPAAALYERFESHYPSGVVLEAFYPGGATLHEAQVGHLYAVTEPVEASRVATP